MLASTAASVSAGVSRDSDHDRLPDRWERKHHLSTNSPSARRDPDRDRLNNRRELRLRTHPRRADTDRDRLRDGAEVRRFHTNPRRRDTDGDRFSDRCELRKGTNPRKRRSHPKRGCSAPPRRLVPPAPGPPASGPWPDASNTGVPAGTALTPSGGMTINTAGAVINARDISGAVVVNAPNVTIRRSRIRSSSSWAVENNSTGLLIEDSEIDGLGANGHAIGSANMTLRRVNIHGAENGLDVDGNLIVEDSYIHDLTTANGAHTDGAQFNQGASDIVFRHNTIAPVAGSSGGTSCIIMWDEGGAQNTRVRIEDNRLLGRGVAYTLYSPRQQASQIYINRNRFIAGKFGTTSGVHVGTTVTEFNGNVYDDTGKPVSP